MDAARMRRADTTKGPPLRILSLDGGGVRGYSMLILLQELMHRVYVETHGKAPKREEMPKPCDHFDLIAGVGTGGLIAIMLGRLRMDIDTCMDVYIRMTKYVFETDKTFAGIPYRSTLFKASKLEYAIRNCVRQHTRYEEEGNDSPATPQPMSPMTPQRTMSTSSRASRAMFSPVDPVRDQVHGLSFGGNADALLYDERENRTKTAVTAVYKGTKSNGNSVLLRSYDSRREPRPEVECKIWEAGRATSAAALAFKPIQIGQSVFLDEGAGKYNPSPQILDEATINEWPGRDVGVFVSIGTGKRPPGTNDNKSQWYDGLLGPALGDFAEARRRLMSKIEDCERTHEHMMKEHLAARGVNPSNYYRLNVEVGVGEFGMNEWNRMTDISTNTRRYLAKNDVQNINLDAASKMAKIHRAKARLGRNSTGAPRPLSWECNADNEPEPPSNPTAVELPAEDVPADVATKWTPAHYPSIRYQQTVGPDEKFTVLPGDASYPPSSGRPSPHSSYLQPLPPRRSGEHSYTSSVESFNSQNGPSLNSPPPVPPKTPLNARDSGQYQHSSPLSPVHNYPHYPPQSFRPPGPPLPYPDIDGPPPKVNTATKPQFGR